ncbi:hypothetical protein [Luteococcus japonicus]|nr:hypothetical protein [Luteococcus japonicus]
MFAASSVLPASAETMTPQEDVRDFIGAIGGPRAVSQYDAFDASKKAAIQESFNNSEDPSEFISSDNLSTATKSIAPDTALRKAPALEQSEHWMRVPFKVFGIQFAVYKQRIIYQRRGAAVVAVKSCDGYWQGFKAANHYETHPRKDVTPQKHGVCEVMTHVSFIYKGVTPMEYDKKGLIVVKGYNIEESFTNV